MLTADPNGTGAGGIQLEAAIFLPQSNAGFFCMPVSVND
jgi:hypothetical protein